MIFEFCDVHSGGSQKLAKVNYYIEAASQDDAVILFTKWSGLDPYNVTCDCCGDDFWVNSVPNLPVNMSLEQGTFE